MTTLGSQNPALNGLVLEYQAIAISSIKHCQTVLKRIIIAHILATSHQFSQY